MLHYHIKLGAPSHVRGSSAPRPALLTSMPLPPALLSTQTFPDTAFLCEVVLTPTTPSEDRKPTKSSPSHPVWRLTVLTNMLKLHAVAKYYCDIEIFWNTPLNFFVGVP